jgi:hypothetical protein
MEQHQAGQEKEFEAQTRDAVLISTVEVGKIKLAVSVPVPLVASKWEVEAFMGNKQGKELNA